MFFNGTALGISYLDGYTKDSITYTYDYIKIYGEQLVNYLQVENTVMTDDELDNITYNDIPYWGDNTNFLATFNKLSNGNYTLEAGNVQGLSGTLSSIDIQRREGTNLTATDLENISLSSNTYEDLTAWGNKSYTYTLFPVDDAGQRGSPVVSPYIDTNFYNYSLTSTDKNIVFIFDLNLQSQAFKNNIDRTEYKTFTKYNTISRGKKDFMSGSITAMCDIKDFVIGEVDSRTYIDTLRDIINDGTTKILKNRAGRAYWVDTFDFQYQYVDDIGQQPFNVTFSFQEIQDPIE